VWKVGKEVMQGDASHLKGPGSEAEGRGAARKGNKSKGDILRWMHLGAWLLNILYEEKSQEVKLHSSGIQASLSLRHRITDGMR